MLASLGNIGIIAVCTGALVNKNPAQGLVFELVFGLWTCWLTSVCCAVFVMCFEGPQ